MIMPFEEVVWTDRAIRKIAEHGVTMDEVEQALANPQRQGRSASSSLPYTMGVTNARRWLVVIYERVDAITICPVTAYGLDD